MANYGFNFRSTSGFIVDPSGTTYVASGAYAYPQTRNGITFGWTTNSFSFRDRDNTINPRVAGFALIDPSSPQTFRVDLPSAGQYDIGCAMGDASNAQDIQYIEIFDNTTSLLVMQSPAGTTAFNYYYDIGGTQYPSDAAWFSGQVFRRLTFASTTLFAVIGKSGVGVNHCFAHLDVNSVSGGGGGGGGGSSGGQIIQGTF